MDQLKEHFIFKLDDRYHCKYCGHSTQLTNKALSHLRKRHGDQLAAAEDREQEKEPGQDEWGQEPEPESADKN